MLEVIPIPAFTDNYIWAIINTKNKQTAIVDPGDAAPVLSYLDNNALILNSILITHHHADHTHGIPALLENQTVPVYGPAQEPIPHCTQKLKEGDAVILDGMGVTFQVLDVPGHTRGHIAYYGNEWLFCGDTLFAGGCGRLFEGSPAEMLHSLEKLAALPLDTAVYCAHEYTENNLRFASTVEPKNTKIQQRLQSVIAKRAKKQVTLPSTIGLEKQTNPFLRSTEPELIATISHKINRKMVTQIEVFAETRSLKDRYTG